MYQHEIRSIALNPYISAELELSEKTPSSSIISTFSTLFSLLKFKAHLRMQVLLHSNLNQQQRLPISRSVIGLPKYFKPMVYYDFFVSSSHQAPQRASSLQLALYLSRFL